jgi:hypothetical protein
MGKNLTDRIRQLDIQIPDPEISLDPISRPDTRHTETIIQPPAAFTKENPQPHLPVAIK